MQKLTHVTLGTGEMTIYLEGWYLTSTEAGDHASGLDDVVKGRSPFPMPALWLHSLLGRHSIRQTPCAVARSDCRKIFSRSMSN